MAKEGKLILFLIFGSGLSLRTIIAIIFVCLLGINVNSSFAQRQAESPPILSLDNTVSSQMGIIRDFLRATISESSWQLWVWRTDSANFVPPIIGDSIHRALRTYVPWVVEYVLREKGSPTSSALNIWPDDPIKIGFGWPNFLQPYQRNLTDKITPDIIEEANNITNNITRNTDVNLQILTEESPENYANFRIIFYKQNEDAYKLDRRPSLHDISFIKLESLLVGAIPFSPYTPYSVDGYLLTSKDNEIKWAVCYIWEGHPPQVMRSLLKECVVRGLGFPGISDFETSILSAHKNGNNETGISPDDYLKIRILYHSELVGGESYYVAYRTAKQFLEKEETQE